MDGTDSLAPDAVGTCAAAVPAVGHTKTRLIDLTDRRGHPAAAVGVGAGIAAAAVYLQDTGTAWQVTAGCSCCWLNTVLTMPAVCCLGTVVPALLLVLARVAAAVVG